MKPINEEPACRCPGPTPTSLPPFIARALNRAEYQRLWLRMESREWRTLAVVPGEERLSIYDAATLLMALGAHHGETIGLYDFRDVRLNRVLAFIKVASEQMCNGERLIFATRSIKENLATIPLARAADGVVLCVSLGTTSIRLVEETIEQIGKDRFLGTLLIREPPRRAARDLLRLEA